MGEHIEIGIVTGFAPPILERFNPTSTDGFLGFGTVFHFPASMLGPQAEILRVTFSEFFYRNTFPFAKIAFSYAGLRMHGKTERIGESMSGINCPAEIGTDDKLLALTVITLDIKLSQSLCSLLDLPLPHFIQWNIDLSLKPVSGIIGSPAVSYQGYGMYMLRCIIGKIEDHATFFASIALWLFCIRHFPPFKAARRSNTMSP